MANNANGFSSTGDVYGHTCSQCGQFVPNGTLHLCYWHQGYPYPVFDSETPALLREIRDLLKQLVENKSVTMVVNNSLTPEQLKDAVEKASE